MLGGMVCLHIFTLAPVSQRRDWLLPVDDNGDGRSQCPIGWEVRAAAVGFLCLCRMVPLANRRRYWAAVPGCPGINPHAHARHYRIIVIRDLVFGGVRPAVFGWRARRRPTAGTVTRAGGSVVGFTREWSADSLPCDSACGSPALSDAVASLDPWGREEGQHHVDAVCQRCSLPSLSLL
jgi:hypothetical protein